MTSSERRAGLIGLTLTLSMLLAAFGGEAAAQAPSQPQVEPSTEAVQAARPYAMFGPTASDAWTRLAQAPEAVAVLERAQLGLGRPPGAIPVIHTEGTLPESAKSAAGHARIFRSFCRWRSPIG
jgi:hypothetical protein